MPNLDIGALCFEKDEDASGAVKTDLVYLQARRWLEAVSRSWWTFVPDDALPMMLPAMVGALAHAELEEYRDVLDAA